MNKKYIINLTSRLKTAVSFKYIKKKKIKSYTVVNMNFKSLKASRKILSKET